MYAGRKRKKPVPKSPKPPPPEGVKSNPSKRHRDRLNQELNKLTNLLPFPEDVRSRLDKLSILRLAVGYLKVKSYLMATATDVGDCVPRAPGGNRQMDLQANRELFPEGELLLQALNGFVIAVTGDGYIFYISPTVQDYLGFHQSDLIYRSVYELIHADDRASFRCQLHQAPASGSTQHAANAFPANQLLLDGCSTVSSPQHLHLEKPSFVERSFTCRFRCLLDNSSGFLALNFRGRLKCLLGQQKKASDRSPLALFAIATVLQPLSILELQTKTLIFQTKHKLDFTPMACDSRGKVVLGYTETELCRRGSGYQFVHAADMMHCAENHVRMMKTGESGLTVFRLLTKKGGWVWVQANARLVYRAGKPDCIIAQQRALSNEEGEEHLQKRKLQLPFSFATGEAVLYENDLPGFLDSFQAKEELQTQANSHSKQRSVDPNSLLGAMMKQDASIYISHTDNVPQFSLPDLITEPDGLSQNEEVSDAKEDSNSLLVIIETLFEKSGVDGNICQTLQSLNVDSAELQQWEEALLTLDAEEEPPAQEVGKRLGAEVTSSVEQMLLREDAGKSMDFLNCSASPCDEENSAAPRFQHCWATNSVFQAPPESQEPGAQGQDAVISLVSITSKVSSAQPEQQVLFNSSGLVEGTVLDVPVSSSKSSVALQLANPGQVLQGEVNTSAPIDNVIPSDQIQPRCKLVGSSCPPLLHSNTLVTQWHNVLVRANPANALGQSTSGGCPSEAWMAIAPKQLEVAGRHVESQTLLAGSPESPQGAGPWLLPSQPAPCPAQGLNESSFSGAGDLHHEEVALPAQASAPLGVSHLPGNGGFLERPLISHLEPSFSWEGEQAVLRGDKRFAQRQPWLLQTGASHWRCGGAGAVQHSRLLLGSSTGPSTHWTDHVVLPECQYGNSLCRHEGNFIRDASKLSIPQHLGTFPSPSESHPGVSHYSQGSVLRCSSTLPAKVGAGPLPSSEQSPGFFPSESFAGGQPLCACEVQLKVRCEGCRT
ncbi:neuronal PAS domain-containing protein 2-like [Athene cunicularia]|uniref:neuronal PAS domain-containing protein 2-like n=1 Tax=Athene cunicularia TaxID=194338 RepID=UPI000EF6A0A4|nr:neuronal PAS domain-containing protein 2-like [Athene cunicularia]